MPQTASTLRVSREAIARTREYARRIDGVDSARRREVCTGHTAGFFPETTCDDPSHCATIDRVRESNQCIVRSMLFMGMSDVLGVVDLELFHTAAAFAGAVAIDAIVLTVCDFEANAQLRRALRWAFWVTLAHWILAAAGLSGLWTLRMGLPSVAPVLQVATALLLSALVVQLIAQSWRAKGPVHREGQLGFAAKVWIVSADALFVGAGESGAAGLRSAEQVSAVLLMLGPMILLGVGVSIAAACWVSRLVDRQVIHADKVAAGGAIGLPAVAVPIFSYLVLCTVRGIHLS